MPPPPTLPTFDAPPLVEVVFGRQFDPLPLTAAHTGLFWQRLGRDAYPQVQEQPPLPPMIERFGEDQVSVVELGDVFALPRLWFTSVTGDALVQVQRDRFLVNWRASTTPYPRYVTLRPQFEALWSTFEGFSRAEFDIAPVVQQYELTYVNHIPWHPDWQDLGAALRFVFPDLGWRPGTRFLPSPEGTDVRLAVRLPKDAGRLHLRLREGRRKTDGARLFMLEFTARGLLPSASEWFDLAHEWIVHGFADLTSAEMQEQAWQRRS